MPIDSWSSIMSCKFIIGRSQRPLIASYRHLTMLGVGFGLALRVEIGEMVWKLEPARI